MIEAISRGCKGTLSDGVVRYVFDIDPIYAADAAKLFGMPGTSVVLAALTPEAAKQSAQDETIAADKPKGGQLAKLAGMWCQDKNFYNFIQPVYDKYMGGNGNGFGDADWTIVTAEFARHAILVICEIDSRAELDHNNEAARKFHKLIREPYIEYLKTI